MTLLQKFSIVFMLGLAGCLFAENQSGIELAPSQSVVVESQIKDSKSSIDSKLSVYFKLTPPSSFRLQESAQISGLKLVVSDLTSDYFPPLTSEASSFSHHKQRPVFELVELAIKPWLDLSVNRFVATNQAKPKPWYIVSFRRQKARISGWKESNINFKKHLYFI